MTGRIIYRGEKGRGGPESESICGLSILRGTLYEPEGLSAGRLERRVHKLEGAFREAGVSRVILPDGFPHTSLLRQLKPVEPLLLYRGAADVLVLGQLQARHVLPGRGRVALAGPRLCPELRETVVRLCPYIRAVRIDVPGAGGEDFARALQREYGLPVLPPKVPVDVTVSFGPSETEEDLRLWGERPDLGGLTLTTEKVDLPADAAQPVLALLWEQGGIKREDLRAIPARKSPLDPCQSTKRVLY